MNLKKKKLHLSGYLQKSISLTFHLKNCIGPLAHENFVVIEGSRSIFPKAWSDPVVGMGPTKGLHTTTQHLALYFYKDNPYTVFGLLGASNPSFAHQLRLI